MAHRLRFRREWVPCGNDGDGGYGWFDQFDRPYGAEDPAKTGEPRVRVGQVYKDNDDRVANPYIRVDAILIAKALVMRGKALAGPFTDCREIALGRLAFGGARGYTILQDAPIREASAT